MSSIDELMGFDSRSLDVFQEKPQSNFDVNVYKTNPKDSKSESGNYISKIKILYNPFNVKESIVHQANYWCEDSEGGFLVKSKLGNGDKTCPIFTGWKRLWFSGDESKKEWAKQMFQKTESNWVLVQIIEDDNRPELIGQFRVMKLPQAIYDKLSAKMNPAPETKKAPVPVMDYLIGLPVEMNVQPGPDDPKNPSRKQREISYTLCDFASDYEPIIKTDGTPLFDDSELAVIDDYVEARANLQKPAKAAAAQAKITEITPKIKELYSKALNYMKENAPDVVKECGFQEWDEKTTTRVNAWLENISKMVDPKIAGPNANPLVAAGEAMINTNPGFVASDPFASAVAEEEVFPFPTTESKPDDDLPF